MEIAPNHTGLPLGVPERASAQRRRKEVYRHELLQQMGQQARNRRKEKELDLKVAASGAVDPEKEPGRLREFSAVVREPPRSRVRPGGRVVADSGPPLGRAAPRAWLLDGGRGERPDEAPGAGGGGGGGGAGDEFRGSGGLNPFMSWDMLALMMSPRAAAPHPAPPPPLVMDSTRTPYDEAYFFYGAHDPLDPSLTHRGRPFGVQHSADDLGPYRHRQQGPGASVAVPGPQRVTAVSGARRAVGPTSQLGSDFVPGSADRGKQREKHQRYQEELEEQMRVQEVRRQRQREERERYESRIEEEASAFSPWGKGGGGAPLRDAEGNLITDLKQMHKQNEEAYKNPHHRPRGDARAVLSLDLNLATPRAGMGGGGDSPHKYPGFGYAYRGALQHAGPVTEQQARAQGLYKDFLKQQIEEKRRREAEERARTLADEEREERRLQQQRESIRAEYEHEQARRQRQGLEHRAKNEEVLREAEEKLRRESEERRLRDDAERRRQREESARAREQPRGGQRVTDSPPVPALMKERRRSAEKRAATPPKALKYERPDTASSIGSPRRHLMRDGEQGALSDLSHLRQQLRSERQQLEGELRAAGRASPEDRPSPAPRRRREKERPRSAVRVFMPPTPVEELNFQTLRDFHDLKYRVDSPSRAALRRLFPEPATDAAALELQQTTLLGEQQRKLHALNARLHGTGDLFPAAAAPFTVNAAEQPPFSHPGLEPRAPILSSLGDEFMMGDLADVPRARRVSFVDPTSSPPGTPATAGSALRLLPDSFSLGSTSSSLNVERIQARNHERLRRLHGWDNDVAAGPGEASPLFIPGRHRPGSAISADSITSVATEPWLRPGSRGSLRLDLGVLSTGAGD